MVKAVGWGGMLVLALGGMFWGMQVMNADHGELIGYAIGEPDDAGVCELQVVVTTMMEIDDPPQFKPTTNSLKPDWELWGEEHLVAVDDSTGQAVTWREGRFKSDDITEAQFGNGELILLADLEAGKAYTMHYVPVAGEPRQYVQQLTGEAKEFRRETFAPDY